MSGRAVSLGLEAGISLLPQLIASAFRRCKIYTPSYKTAPVYFICEQVCKGQCGRLYLSNLAFELLHWKCWIGIVALQDMFHSKLYWSDVALELLYWSCSLQDVFCSKLYWRNVALNCCIGRYVSFKVSFEKVLVAEFDLKAKRIWCNETQYGSYMIRYGSTWSQRARLDRKSGFKS